MKSGVSIGSFAEDATFAVVTGTADPGSYGYAIGNIADVYDPGEVARVTPDTGTVVFTAVLSADCQVQCLALNEHNIPDGGSAQVELFSDDSLTTLAHDTGAVAIPTPTPDPQTFPVLLDAAITVRSIRVTVTGLTDDLEIGSMPVGGFWEWPWITEGLEAAFDIGGSEQVLVGGGSYGPEGEDFRTRNLTVNYMELATSSTTGLDWQDDAGLTRPRVFIEDYSDPATWPRACFLAVNTDLSLMTAVQFDRDTVSFKLREVR